MAGTASFLPYVAGAEANVAVGLARLGRSVALIGRVGDDGLGVRIARSLRAEGVDVAGLAVDPDAPTGVMIRERPGLGPSEVVYARTGSAGSRLGPDDVAAAAARGAFSAAPLNMSLKSRIPLAERVLSGPAEMALTRTPALPMSAAR